LSQEGRHGAATLRDRPDGDPLEPVVPEEEFMRARYALPMPMLLLACATPVQADKVTVLSTAVAGCEVRATKVPGGLRLEAIVSGQGGNSGEYQFEVRKSAGGSSSTTAQGGTFEVGAGQETILSEVTLSGAGTPVAELSVEWANGETCAARYPA